MMSLRDRYWLKVNRCGKACERLGTRCWAWKSGKKDGYGVLWKSGKRLLAHRVSWEIANGPIPDGLNVLHHCDNPECTRPDHLFLGTDTDNVHDMDAKGRRGVAKGERNGWHLHPDRMPVGHKHWAHLHPEWRARGERHGSRTHPEALLFGQDHPLAKLTQQQVDAIRSDGGKQREIAARYGVSQRTIGRILHGKTWTKRSLGVDSATSENCRADAAENHRDRAST